MSSSRIPPSNPHAYPQVVFFTPDGEVGSEQPIPVESKPLTQDDFPSALIKVIGKERFDSWPERVVEDRSTGYFDGCFSLKDFPECGGMKGRDQDGRVYIAFAVNNPRYKEVQKLLEQKGLVRAKLIKETGLITVFERYAGGGSYFIVKSSDDSIPTDDRRFSTSNKLSLEICSAIQKIFEGKHPDLRFGIAKQQDCSPDTEQKT